MAKLANFLQEMNLNIEPKTLLYIFIGLACLSLIAICSVMLSNLKAPNEKARTEEPKEKAEEKEIIRKIKAAKIILPEDDLSKEEIVKDVEINNDFSFEEMPHYESLDDVSQKVDKIEIPTRISEEKETLFNSKVEIKEENDALSEAITETIEPDEEAKEPLYKTMPKIFSSVYLEPRGEDSKRTSNIFIQEESSTEQVEEIIPEEIVEDIPIEKPGIKIFPDIIDEIKAHRDKTDEQDISLPFDKNKTKEKKPGIIYPSDEEQIIVPEEEDNKEVVLTPDMLKERLAMLTKLMSESNQASSKEATKSKNTNELDHILKQIGLDKTPTNFEDEEKIILGR